MQKTRSFLFGFFGAMTFLILAQITSYQFSDYRARAQTSEWLSFAKSIHNDIEKNGNNASFSDTIKPIENEYYRKIGIEAFRITKTDVIVLRGGVDGQVVVLIPYSSGEKMKWHCIGGSAKSVSIVCRKTS